MNSADEKLKSQVHTFWNQRSCGTEFAQAEKFSRDYFEDIEAARYRDQAFIHSFAQFTRYCGRKVVEVGFGAGTDFIQWLRAGAAVSGVDLTDEALANLSRRIEVYGLPPPEEIRVADAEHLPFPSATFDLGYSFGVLHHTPDMEKAMAELVRVVRPGGEVKVMLYNLHSLCAFKVWLKHALWRGKGLRWAVWNHIESAGTKAYSRGELSAILGKLPLQNVRVRTEVTGADYLAFSQFKPANLLCRAALRLAGCQESWRFEDYLAGSGGRQRKEMNPRIQFTGNRLGWFHCITATKTG